MLGVQELPGRPLQTTLADALHSEQLLLVLDNCEHLIEACAALGDSLLRECRHLEILATSREALGIAGETTRPVPPLALVNGASASPADLAAMRQSEAVQLFVARARSARPAFVLTERNAPAVVQVCRRLDGIPLALELAAARVRVLPVEQLALRLDAAISEGSQGRTDDRFRLLTGAVGPPFPACRRCARP